MWWMTKGIERTDTKGILRDMVLGKSTWCRSERGEKLVATRATDELHA
jgi:hypothetical protein